MAEQNGTKASTSLVSLLWRKLQSNFLPLGICLALLAFSITQALYFRADLRKLMLETGRRTQYKVSSDKKDWLYDAKKLFDGNLQSFARIPFIEMEEGKAELSIELALTHFPSPKDKPIPIPRRPILLEIYNGACSQCSLSIFQKHNRIRTGRLELLLRKLKLPIVDYLLPEEISIWQKKIFFPDRPGPQKIDLSSLLFYRTQENELREIGVVILRVYVDSIYPGKLEREKLSLAEIRYADQDLFQKTKVHYWH